MTRCIEALQLVDKDVPTQNMQHFMSNSPWSGSLLVSQVRADVAAQDEFQSGTMVALGRKASMISQGRIRWAAVVSTMDAAPGYVTR